MRSSIRLAAVTVTAAAMVGASATVASAGPRDGGDSLSQTALQNCLSVEQEGEAETERSLFSSSEVEQENIFLFFGPFVCTQVSSQVVAPITVFGSDNVTEWELEAEGSGEAVDLEIEAGNGLPPEIASAEDINAQTARMVESALAGNAMQTRPAADAQAARPAEGAAPMTDADIAR